MPLKIYFFLGQCLIYYNLFYKASSTPIVGELVRDAQDGEFSSIVSIGDINDETEGIEMDQTCSGVLITDQHILTAAHCILDSNINETQVIVGSRDVTRGIRYGLRWWVTYEEWAERYNMLVEYYLNDIAILKLDDKVPAEIKPASLSTLTNKEIFGKEVVTAGWGVTENDEHPRILRTVSLKVLTNNDCESRIKKETKTKIPIHERFICTTTKPHALLMPGDSGAPVFYQGKVHAIHKSTAPYPNVWVHPKKINIHTGIDYYRRFILNVISLDIIWS